jgi:Protein kinase domain/AAA ATPase domain
MAPELRWDFGAESTFVSSSEQGENQPPSQIGDRYRVVRTLGHGGMASVYECVDEATGKHLAIKQLHAHRAGGDGHIARLFELEFHTLTQLAHPRVVSVYDYQKRADGAFYTMELLDGDDLRGQHSLPWKVVCSLLCDVCSALSLLHSRRLVHRDVTPRNIRLTRDGKAKLIDFGAMVPFGTHRRTVGTPAFTAPEAVTGQPLDGRADLFSLGATAYYALTGRDAYPARSFDRLRNAWRSQPLVPSRYAPDIPPDLDHLVMWLLALPASRRPASAGAVMERLTAIAGLQLGDQLQVQRAFLSTPSLVGREAVLQQVRRQTIHASRGRPTTLFLTGPRGVGRSRMVDACALEGKLANALVLRADAEDAEPGDWGGVRSLLEQLLIERPSQAAEVLAPYAPTLAHVWPRVSDLTGTLAQRFADARALRLAVQDALSQLIKELARGTFIMITADDIERVDEPTRAFIALLAQQIAGRRIMIVAAANSGALAADLPGLRLLQQHDATIALEPHSRSDSERLLISVFGEVPNVRLLANRLYELTAGLPALTMQMAQHLLDRDVILFRDGGWILPSQFDSDALPTNLTDALRARIALLDAGSLELARVVALSGRASVTLDDCARLSAELPWTQVLVRLDVLVRAQVLQMLGDRYSLSQPGWTALLVSQLDPAYERTLHACIASAFAHEPKAEFYRAGHLLAAHDPEPAIDLLLAHGASSGKELALAPERLAEHISALPDDWMATLERAIAAADSGGRPLRQRMALRRQLVQLPVPSQPRPVIAGELVQQLYGDSGLRDYAALPDSMPPAERLKQALQQAAARYEATPEPERDLPPAEAIPVLARTTVQIIGMLSPAADFPFLHALPSLAPLAPLSPALVLVKLNLDCTCDMMAGRNAQAHRGFTEIMERMAISGEIGMHPASQHYMQLSVTYAVATIETTGGLAGAAAHTALLEQDPLFEVAALRLRMLHALMQGDLEGADVYERKAELVRIRNPPTQLFESSTDLAEVAAHVEIGDVARIRQVLRRLDVSAEKFRYWAAPPLFARGQILRLRGQAAEAVEVFENALSKTAVGMLRSWLPIVRGSLLALAESGRAAEAGARGLDFLQQAHAAGLSKHLAELHHALATVALAARDCDAARAHLRQLDELRRAWPGSLVFGGACDELRARVALVTGDPSAFADAARACGQAFLRNHHPILIARHQRLLQDAERTGMQLSAAVRASQDDSDGATDASDGKTRAAPTVELSGCAGFDERIGRVIALATEAGTGQHAMLYLVRDKTLSLVGQLGDCPEPERMNALVSDYLREELQDSAGHAIDPDDLVTSTVDSLEWIGPTGVQFAPALMSHATAEGRAITGVFVFDIEGQPHPDDDLLAALSRALTEAHDVVPVRAAS